MDNISFREIYIRVLEVCRILECVRLFLILPYRSDSKLFASDCIMLILSLSDVICDFVGAWEVGHDWWKHRSFGLADHFKALLSCIMLVNRLQELADA